MFCLPIEGYNRQLVSVWNVRNPLSLFQLMLTKHATPSATHNVQLSCKQPFVKKKTSSLTFGLLRSCNSSNHLLCTKVITFSFEYLLFLCNVRSFVRPAEQFSWASKQPTDLWKICNFKITFGSMIAFIFAIIIIIVILLSRIKLWPFFDIIVRQRQEINRK